MKHNKKKILFILHIPPPIHGSSVIGEMIRESKKINTKFENIYINLSTSRKINEIGKNGIHKIFTYLRTIIKIIKNLIFMRPDLVYIALTSKGFGFYKDFVIILLIKLFNYPVVYHFHNKGVNLREKFLLDNIMYKITFRNSKVILLSELLYYDIKKYINKKNVYYCANGLPKMNSKKTKAYKQDVTRLLFFSNLIESKGVNILLQALKILKNDDVEFFCDFAGSEGDISKKQFEDRVANLNLENHARYLGRMINKSKIDVFNSADIFVHPTCNDCFPLVLLEASQFKLPIISTYEGAIPEIVENGINGYLVNKNNPEELADRIRKLINDKGLRLSMGISGYKKFNKKFQKNQFEKKFSEILKIIIK